jgi:hypothetical protein
LPESLRKHWQEYQPEGEVDADLRLSFDGMKWNPNLIVKCLNVAFTYHKFPYRFERAGGTLVLAAGFLASFVLGRASAALRHLIWTAPFLALLALPMAFEMAPKIALSAWPAATVVRGTAAAGAPTAMGHTTLARSQKPPPNGRYARISLADLVN